MTEAVGTVDLCALADLDDPGAKGFEGRPETKGRPFFVVRRHGEVFGYVDVCPHRAMPLEFLPDRFLDIDRAHILCSVHGALFDIADGRCVQGPCVGAALEPLAVRIVDGQVILEAGG